MRKYAFTNANIDPEQAYSQSKKIIEGRGLKITSEEIQDRYWDLHARKSGIDRIVTGTVRDVNLILTGDRKNLGVQLHAGIWGRDYIVPAIEGVATLGLAAAAEVRAAHEFEENLWEDIVHVVEPEYLVCERDGTVFETEAAYEEHMKGHSREDTETTQFRTNLQTGFGV